MKQILGSRYNIGKYKGGNYKQFYHHINCENVCFPVGFSDIEILEKNNPYLRFHIYVFGGSDYFKIYQTKITLYHQTIEHNNKNSFSFF